MDTIGRYQILGELGKGAMGVVYRALDPAIGRTVAIKTIRLARYDDAGERQQMRDRLFREAQSAGILSHPHIVTIYDVAEEGGNAYIFMEFVDGPTLDRRLAASPALEPSYVLEIFRQCASALDYAHRKGIVHRDIKPANVMIAEGDMAKITDFGIARMESRQMTASGMILGTPNYMSPEQFAGGALTGRSDQFSLAVIAYEVLTGEKPFLAESLPTLMYRIISEPATPPHRINPSLGPAIDAVLLRAMAKDANERYPSCAEFIGALIAACQATPGWQPLPPGSSAALDTMAGPKPAARPPSQALLDSAEMPTMAVPPPPIPPRPEAVPAAPVPVPIPEPTLGAAGGTAGFELPPPARSARDYQEAPPPSAGHTIRYVALAGLLVGLLGGGIALWLWPGGGQGEKPPPESSVASSTPAAPDKPSPEGNRPTNPPPAPPQSAPAATQPPPSPEGGGATPSTTTIPPTPAPPKDKPAGGGSNTGDLFVSITTVPPGAQITFDNNTGQACVAPCNFTLTAGRHTIQAKLDGYRPAMRIFELPKEQNVTVNLDKQQGTLRVTTEPAGATVLINGQKQGQPTPAVLTLAPGKYKIELVRDGYQTYTDEVTVRDQAIGQLNISLPKNP